MKIAILDTSEKTVLNVIKAGKIGDLEKVNNPEKYVEALPWMSPGEPYEEVDGVLSPVAVPITQEQIAAAENALYRSCLAYQVDQIDTNMSSEIAKSESLVEAGKATAADLPEAGQAGLWIEALWVEYYTRKADALNASLDFSTVGPVPNSFATIRTERKTFLAGA